MFTQKNRDRHTEVVRDELDSIQAQISTTFLKEHANDGSHRFPAGDVVPVGASVMWFTDTAPNSKWLFCRGQQVSRSTYSSLFNLLGTTYGVGDGSTTFNLPNLQQRFPLGKAAAGTGSVLAGTGGAIDHTHTGPSHTHSISSQAAHTHTIDSHGHGIQNDGDHSHSGVTGGPNNTILVDRNLDALTRLVGDADVGHTHNISTDGDHDHGGTTDGSGTLTSNSGGSHDHGAVTGAGGTGNTGTNNPPFIAINFIIFTGVEVN